MNVNEAKDAIKVAYEANVPLFLSGQPGVGKSTCVYQIADEIFSGKDSVIELRGSTADPSEIADVKFVVEGKLVNIPQDWVPTEESVKAGRHPERGIVFLDELLDAPTLIQSGFQQFVLDRRLGSAILAEGWYPLAASNRRSDQAAAGKLSTALASRFMHITAEHDLETTIKYAYKKNWNPMIPAFLRWRPELLNTFNPSRSSTEYAYACGRSWESASKLLSVKTPISDDIRVQLLQGTIGQGPAAEFLGFERTYKSIPNMDEIRRSPATASVPDDPSVVYAVIGNLLHKIDKKFFDHIWDFVNRMEPEFIVTFVKSAKQIDEAICSTKAFSKFVTAYGSLVIGS